jgi:hypothetical protein
MLVASLIRDVACQMPVEPASSVPPDLDSADDLANEQADWPTQSRYWRLDASKTDEPLMPGMWSMPFEYDIMPRMRVLDGWNPNLDSVVPPFHPTCLSTRAKESRYNLTASSSYDWEHWIHPDYPDKPYMIARKPGATISFEMHTEVGWIKMYSLRSKTFGLGTVKCWVDDDMDQSVKIVGWWDNGDVYVQALCCGSN